ncbi:MAG: VWA domain-containing protein [Lachnospiraceae bacterium]|nr:VWA domain-containing protein [Lachnospiraceae bacterium]
MGSIRIYIENPWLWLLLLPLLVLTLWPVFRLPKAGRFTKKRKLSLGLHITILVLLVALLSGVTIYQKKEEVHTIVLVDMSASTENSRMAAETCLGEIVAAAGERNRVGVVTFAENALYVSDLNETPEEILYGYRNATEVPESRATNLEEALYYAESLLANNVNRRIVLLTDGMETDGEAMAAAKILAEQGVRVDAVCLPSVVIGYEMQVNSLKHPADYVKGQTTTLSAVVQSNYEGAAEIQFMDNGEIISRRIVTVKEGMNEFTAEYAADSIGVHELSAKIIPVQDEIPENNAVYSWFAVDGAGKILLIDGTGVESSKLCGLLSEEYEITVIEPFEAAGYEGQLVAFQEVILMNVSNRDLPEGFDKALETYVERYGGGLLTTGGGNTYAYGDMTGSGFEKLLPVTMEQTEKQTTAMMIVVDTSSSMQGTNHQMAISGTMQCIEALAETDYVGVLTFDRTVHVIYDLSSMAYEEEILNAVEGITLGRGTYMTDAMQEAFDQLKNFEADKKHVIILSDGEPQDSGYLKVVRQMKANGITVSAIAVGRGADRRIMQMIAFNGDGNYYNVSTVADLPNVMVEEAEAAIADYKISGTFPVDIASYSTVLSGIETEELPSVSGYMKTFAKSGATLHLTVNGGEPLYVQWNYGDGKAGSFTSDLRGTDSEELFLEESGQQLIKNMVGDVLRKEGSATALKVLVEKANQTAWVEVAAETEGKDSLTVTVLLPDGSSETVDMVLTTEGTYRGAFQTVQPGAYTITVTHLDGEKNLLDFTQQHMAVSYSSEYDAFPEENGEEQLCQICETTGGVMAYTVSEVLEAEGSFLEQEWNPSVVLLVLVFVLFLAELMVRNKIFPEKKSCMEGNGVV